jgi:predicted DCC family thiol-disulfide oxidoreductase YuxK
MSSTSTADATELPRPADRPGSDIVLYDGNCVFCRQQVARLHWFDCQGKLSFLSLHDAEVAERFPDLTHEQLMREMYVIEPNGRRHAGADSLRYLSRRLRRLWWAMPFLHIPFAMPLWRWLYRRVAERRYRLAGKVECNNGSCSLHR